jgi:membrane-associated PAP2 superfamily phosphatase
MEATQPFSRVSYLKGLGGSFLVLVILSVVTWMALRLDLDHLVARLFFSQSHGWQYKDAWLWQVLYQYGTIPGLVLTLTAIVIFSLSLIRSSWRPWRRSMLVVALTAILGAGLLVNAILKPYCGRPRPREVVQYNGQWAYCNPCLDSTPGKGMSFPCGHCTMGFLFVTLAFCWRRSKILAYTGVGFGILLGGLLGITRAAQGAHFLTDIVWSLGTLLITSLLLYYLITPLIENWMQRRSELRMRYKTGVAIGFAVLIVIITISFLTRRPFYEMEARSISIPESIESLVVMSNVDLVKSNLEYQGAHVEVGLLGQGFASPNAQQRIEFNTAIQGRRLTVDIMVVKKGYFSELQHQLFITLPPAAKERIAIDIQQPSGVQSLSPVLP